MNLTYKIKKEDENININSILKNNLHISSILLSKLIKMQKIFLNNKQINTRNFAKENDILSVSFDYIEDNSNIVPKQMNLSIIYEDEWIIALNKPANIAIHPSMLHFDNSLSNGLKFYFDSIGLKKKIRPINRLDFNTSGLVLFAKCEYVQEALSYQMKNNYFHKEYLAFVQGTLDNKSGSIKLPIARKENSIIERCIDSSGQPSITHYDVLKEFPNYTLIKCKLETGRTHQIRVHMAAIGHPIISDTLYGSSSHLINRQALHSYKMSFCHPITNKHIVLTCDMPQDMKNLLMLPPIQKLI